MSLTREPASLGQGSESKCLMFERTPWSVKHKMEPIFFKLCFTVLFVGASVTVQADDLFVETSLGGIKGRNFSSFSGRQFSAFRGIPYAKAPIGALRFHVIGLIDNSVPS